MSRNLPIKRNIALRVFLPWTRGWCWRENGLTGILQWSLLEPPMSAASGKAFWFCHQCRHQCPMFQCRQHQVKDFGKGPNDYRGRSWNRIIKLLPYIRAKPSETDSSFCSVSHHGQFYKPFISTFLHFCISTFLYFYIFIYLHFSFIHFYIFTSETLLKLSISPALKYSRIFKLANIPKYLITTKFTKYFNYLLLFIINVHALSA